MSHTIYGWRFIKSVKMLLKVNTTNILRMISIGVQQLRI